MGHGVSSSRRGAEAAGSTPSSSAAAFGGSKGPARVVRTGGVGGSGKAPIAPASPGGSASKYVVPNTISGPSSVPADSGSVLPIGSLASKLSIYQHCETMECLVLLEDDDIAGIAGIAATDRSLWVRLQLGREQSQYFTGLGHKFVQMSPTTPVSIPTVRSDNIQHGSQCKALVEDGTASLVRPTSIAVEEQLPLQIFGNPSETLSAVPLSQNYESTEERRLIESMAPADVNIMCEYCHEVITSAERRAEHYKVCSRAQELMSAFENVNLNLQSIIFQVTQQNHALMQYLLSSAMRNFEEMTFLDGMTLNLVRRVIDVAPGKQSANSAAALEQELQRRLEQIELEVHRSASSSASSAPPQVPGASQGQQQSPPNVKAVGILSDVITELRRKRSLLKEFTQQSMSVRDYSVVRKLSEGAYSRVFEVFLRDAGSPLGGHQHNWANQEPKTYALKVMSKSFIRQQDMVKRVKRESKVMKMTGSGNNEMFVKLYSSFQSRNFLFIVMEHVKGGDFLAQLIKWGRFPESVSRLFVAELVSAVVYLHDHGVVHRDIKIDNLLITERGHLKLTDFGMVTPAISLLERRNSMRSESGASQIGGSLKSTQEAWLESLSFTDTSREQSEDQSSASFRYNDSSGQLRSAVGNYQYAAPEIVLNLGYDHAVDWWSCGIIFFQFLSGSTPFMDVSSDKTIENIARSAIKWEIIPPEVSDGAKELIRGLLMFHAHLRLGFRSSDDVKGHQYFSGINFDTLFEGSGPIDPFSDPSKSQKNSQKDITHSDFGLENAPNTSALQTPTQLDVCCLDFYNDPPADSAAPNNDEFDSFCIV